MLRLQQTGKIAINYQWLSNSKLIPLLLFSTEILQLSYLIVKSYTDIFNICFTYYN
jgi:hypothetical protein